MNRWSLDGRVAIARGAEGFSGGLSWRQDGAHADIEIRGPLGGTAFSIKVDGERMSVADGRGASLDGDAALEFLTSELGAPLPVSQLRFWLVGVSAPDAPQLESIGTDGRLASLEQFGWWVRYLRYQSVSGIALPARMEIESEGTRMRLAIANWTLVP